MRKSLDAEEMADAMYQMVVEHSDERMKPLDLTRAILKKYGKGSRSLCKQALRLLVSPDRCVYHGGHYIGGCYLIPASDRR